MPFTVSQEKFEGPLELLLKLIDEEKLSISEISLAKTADDYIAYVRSLESIDPEQLAEFLVVAAQLMLIKSRSLLPSLVLTEEEESSIEELEARLKEYQRIRGVALLLGKMEAGHHAIYSREAYQGLEPVFYPPPHCDASVLARMYGAFLAAIPKIEKLAQEKIRKIVSLEEKIGHIRSMLQGTIQRAFSDIVKGAKGKVEVIVSFLAMLELSKQKFLDLRQDKPFEDIIIHRVE